MFKPRVLLIALAVCMLFIAACGAQPPKAPVAAPTQIVAATQVPAPTQAPGATEAPAPTQPPAPTEAPVVTQTAAPSEAPPPATELFPTRVYPPAGSLEYSQPSEVILIGTSDVISTVLGAAKANYVDYLELSRVALTLDSRNLDMALFQVRDLSPEGNDLNAAGKLVSLAFDNGVLGDPNYVTASDQAGASPVEFSPNHIGESAFAAGVGPAAGLQIYNTQWALNEIGLSASCGKLTPDVYMFDAGPVVTATSTLIVDPLDPNLMRPLGCAGGTNHGLFVAGLIRKVAPDANVHLTPVLDCNGVGELWNLLLALKSVPKSGSLVLNLSLGVLAEPAKYGLTDAFLGNVCPGDSVQPGTSGPQTDQRLTLKDLCTLHAVLWDQTKSGAVAVAAAGNTSVKSEQPMQLPARLPYVIGVSAIGPKGVVACYSNEGGTATAALPLTGKQRWVRAPGGLSGPVPGSGACQPLLSQCDPNNPPPDCAYGVVSTIQHQNGDPGYAFWVGTSFATPFVSGLAACCLATNANTLQVWASADKATNVWQEMQKIAKGPGGVINVGATVADCQ
jgi:subtilisin family serine protease